MNDLLYNLFCGILVLALCVAITFVFGCLVVAISSI